MCVQEPFLIVSVFYWAAGITGRSPSKRLTTFWWRVPSASSFGLVGYWFILKIKFNQKKLFCFPFTQSWPSVQFSAPAVGQHPWRLLPVLSHQWKHPKVQDLSHSQQSVHDGREVLQQVRPGFEMTLWSVCQDGLCILTPCLSSAVLMTSSTITKKSKLSRATTWKSRFPCRSALTTASIDFFICQGGVWLTDWFIPLFILRLLSASGTSSHRHGRWQRNL